MIVGRSLRRGADRRRGPSSVAIIGAGVIGALCARFLKDAGLAVTVYDRGVGRCRATCASAGLLVDEDAGQPKAWHVLARRGLELWSELGERFAELEYRRTGMLLLGEQASWREAHGYHTEAADWQGQPALWVSEASVVRPPHVARTLLRDVPWHATRVESLDALLRVHDIAVIAAGAWSQPLLDQVGARVAVGSRRGQMMMMFDRGELAFVLRSDQHQIAVPRADGHIAVGVSWEDVGFDANTDQVTLDPLEAWAREQVPGLGRREAAWAGFRPWSDRNVPTIGWATDRVLVAVGHHRDGLILGPATGEFIRDLILDQPPRVDPSHFRVPTRGESLSGME